MNIKHIEVARCSFPTKDWDNRKKDKLNKSKTSFAFVAYKINPLFRISLILI